MTLRLLGRLFAVPLLLASLPQLASAQEAVLSGTVTDLTGAVLPGATITAVHQATGNKFSTVTDEFKDVASGRSYECVEGKALVLAAPGS